MTDAPYRQVFQPQEVIFREGEVGDSAYLIERGEVRITALRKGRPTHLATLGDGELFGEMALLDDEVRMATAMAHVETEAIVIQRERLGEELDRAGSLIQLVLRVLLRRLRGTSSRALSVEVVDDGLPRVEPRIRDSAQMRAYSRLKLERELGVALERGEMELHYQPIVHLASERTAGFEALVRWRHPDRGLVPPGEFVGVAESSGIIVPMGLWIAEEACRTLKLMSEKVGRQWADPGRGPFMGINVSPRQLADPRFLEQFRTILETTGIQPLNIELEITEDLLLENPEETLAKLRSLKELGLGLVIDDFGTGYSSLSYVNRFPIDIIKVDRSFVLTMLEEEASMRIVAAVVGLARDLGLSTIAEGIETPEQLARLKELGCDHGQGFLLSRPIPGVELLDRI